MKYTQAREKIIEEMVDQGDLIRRGDDIYEDMGGHCLHESNLDDHISHFLENIHPRDRKELMQRIRGEDPVYESLRYVIEEIATYENDNGEISKDLTEAIKHALKMLKKAGL